MKHAQHVPSMKHVSSEALAFRHKYGDPPIDHGHFDIALTEVMYYLYLPIAMYPYERPMIRLPANVGCTLPLIEAAVRAVGPYRAYRYIYLSARKGWATPDNPLNRPGWHCDGFGTDDLNFVWWQGPGTRFLIGDFQGISQDHVESLGQFEYLSSLWGDEIVHPPEHHLYEISPTCIHATPKLSKGCMRQYVKISFSNERYNLYNNSHNYLFDYDWTMVDRAEIRNDTSKAQRDYA